MPSTCRSCIYRGEAPTNIDDDLAICRRYPPTVLQGEVAAGGTAAEPMTVWPIVADDEDWCGEYERRPAPTNVDGSPLRFP